MLEIEIAPALEDNYIAFLLSKDSPKFWCVDPGDERAVAKFLAAHPERRCAGIFCTHHHDDHVGAVEFLAAQTPRSPPPVYGPVHPALKRLVTHPLTEGASVWLENPTRIVAIETPGHTVPALSFLLKGSSHAQTLFSGDTLFGAGCGRLFEGTPEEMWSSLKKLRALDLSTKLYCGHEYTEKNLLFTATLNWRSEEVKTELQRVQALRARGEPTLPLSLDRELRTNPFLNADDPRLLESSGFSADTEPVLRFAELRGRRNHF